MNLPLENLISQVEDVVRTIVGFELLPSLGRAQPLLLLKQVIFHPIEHVEEKEELYISDLAPARL